MEMHFQLRKSFWLIQFISITFFITPNVQAQEGLFKDLLKTADKLNQVLLDLTEVSDEEENQVGEELDIEITKKSKVTNSDKWNIKKVWQDLLQHTSRKNIKYSYKVFKDKDVNAYAVAGGKVYINTGLLDFIKSKDELAFVIAHELAHNELKHCIKRIQHSVTASKIDPTLGAVVQIAYSTYRLPFNKYEEYEADSLGVVLMQKAGYSKQGALDFFTKLAELEKKYQTDKRDPVNDFITTHPYAEKRKERIEKMKGD